LHHPIFAVQRLAINAYPIALAILAVIEDFLIKRSPAGQRLTNSGNGLRICARPLQDIARFFPSNVIQPVSGNISETLIDPLNPAVNTGNDDAIGCTVQRR